MQNGRSNWFDKCLSLASLAGLVLLAVISGAIFTAAEVTPGPQIARAYKGGKALYQKLTAYDDVLASDLWNKQRRPDKGVTVHDAARAESGVTLYTSGHEAAAFLISMDGRVLHEWRRPFSTVWRQGEGVNKPQPDSHVYFRKAVLYPNGDLLVVYEGVGDTPYGYGVAKLDRNSELIWSYPGRAHHDLDVGPDGRIYVLTHELVDTPFGDYANLATPRLEDFLVILSPEGTQLSKTRLLQAVEKSDYRLLLHTVSSYAVADPLHTNTVKVVTEADAANFAFAEPGQILLSFRELGAIAVLDLDSEQLTWAARGPWIGQHDPDILPNGNVLLFDNYGHFRKPEMHARVIEFDPRTLGIVWQYAGTPERPLDSQIRSGQQRLPNGNTLITESNGGRMLEVTREGDIVWEFVNPIRAGKDDDRIPIIASGARIDPKTLDPGLLSRMPPLRMSKNREFKKEEIGS